MKDDSGSLQGNTVEVAPTVVPAEGHASAGPSIVRIPWLVAARLAIEWARVDNASGLRGWGAEHWGQTITVGFDHYIIGHEKVGHDIQLVLTVRLNYYGGGDRSEQRYYIPLPAMLDGVEMPGGAVLANLSVPV